MGPSDARRRPHHVARHRKEPRPGRAKTRLAPAFTARGAAALAAAALTDTLRTVLAVPARRRILVLDGRPGPWLPEPGEGGARLEIVPQAGGSLDERLAAAFALCDGPALLVGMDTPQLTPAHLAPATGPAAWHRHDAFFGPAADGGFWALGLAAPDPALLRGVPCPPPAPGRCSAPGWGRRTDRDGPARAAGRGRTRGRRGRRRPGPRHPLRPVGRAAASCAAAATGRVRRRRGCRGLGGDGRGVLGFVHVPQLGQVRHGQSGGHQPGALHRPGAGGGHGDAAQQRGVGCGQSEGPEAAVGSGPEEGVVPVPGGGAGGGGQMCGGELRGVHADEQSGAVAQRERGGQPFVEGAAGLRHDLQPGAALARFRQPRSGPAVEDEDPPAGRHREHGAQCVGERRCGERGGTARGERGGEPGSSPGRGAAPWR
ncbi:hypothetical protein TPA0909_02570 [Streptomyces albus]|nr:hypothetical protein TPA0909_02570 [Streptomyces albus]